MLLFVLSWWWLSTTTPVSAHPPAAPAPRIIKFAELERVLQQQEDTLYVVNFWATWCGPCIKELPDFEAAARKYADQNVKFLLVSLDFANQFEKKVIPFVEKRKLSSEIVLLDEPDYNTWIDSVEPSWQGSIPATLIFNKKDDIRLFKEGMLQPGELETLIEQAL
ncbi:TlpA family protein disulfide reductase [Catalinimonas alkaloidigena]|nr:TlpA disulfide reductase family protein [Catalinimonas alkaloidigena]